MPRSDGWIGDGTDCAVVWLEIGAVGATVEKTDGWDKGDRNDGRSVGV